jgi:geranylgeranyl pyrophosphate synthase
MNQGNKLAVLCGDFLLATACKNLSLLKNTQVVGLMSEVIADISQTLFLREYQNHNLDSNVNKNFSSLKLWYDTVNR